MGVASMPMYNLPEVRSALDSLWEGLSRNLKREGIVDAPEELVHDRPLSQLWNDSELWFSQCCGYDLVSGYSQKLIPIATPHYGAPECKGCDYASVIVVRGDCEAADITEMRGVVCVINGPESHSGMNALRALVAPLSCRGRFFSQVKVSGTHAGSLEMIKRGEADVAAIDCVTYALHQIHRPTCLSGLRKLGRTDRAPGIPYVTRSTVTVETVARIRTALFRTFDDPQLTSAREALLLKGLEELHVSQYERIAEFQQAAIRHSYPKLN